MDTTHECKISFVTDKIRKGEVKVAFCPTHDMLDEFFTKPMHEKILNLCSSASTTGHRSVLDKQNIEARKNNEPK